MKKRLALFLVLFLGSLTVLAQRNLEVGAGYAYASGNGGLNGFNVDGAVFFTRRVAFAVDYDGVYDTSNIGTFQVTPIGNVTSKNHLQDLLLGPRIYFPGLIKTKNKTINLLNPFGEVELGASHINSELVQAANGSRVGTNDSAFTWMLGGGADVRVATHWAARAKFDLLRTHLADSGQSRIRFVLGVAYFIKPR